MWVVEVVQFFKTRRARARAQKSKKLKVLKWPKSVKIERSTRVLREEQIHFRPIEFFAQLLGVRVFYLPAPKERDSDLTGPVYVRLIGSAIFQKSAVGACVRAKVEKIQSPQNGSRLLKLNAARTTEQFGRVASSISAFQTNWIFWSVVERPGFFIAILMLESGAIFWKRARRVRVCNSRKKKNQCPQNGPKLLKLNVARKTEQLEGLHEGIARGINAFQTTDFFYQARRREIPI